MSGFLFLIGLFPRGACLFLFPSIFSLYLFLGLFFVSCQFFCSFLLPINCRFLVVVKGRLSCLFL